MWLVIQSQREISYNRIAFILEIVQTFPYPQISRGNCGGASVFSIKALWEDRSHGKFGIRMSDGDGLSLLCIWWSYC